MIFQPNLVAHVIDPTDRGHLYPAFPVITHYVGHGPSQYPLTVTRNSSVFLVHYSNMNKCNNEPFSGPVKRLTIHQLGSCEAPNMSAYANTCSQVDFNGYIANTRTAFELISQMPFVEKVIFRVGPSQENTYMESYAEFMAKTPLCRSVTDLKVIMNLDYFHSYPHDCTNSNKSSQCSSGNCLSIVQYSLVCLVESILKHAGDSFPNLKQLKVELPENDRLRNGVKSLIESSSGLRSNTQTTVQDIFKRDKKSRRFRTAYNTLQWCPSENFGVSQQYLPQTSCMDSGLQNFNGQASTQHQQEFTSSSSEEYYNHPMPQRSPPGFPPLNPRDASPVLNYQPDVHQRINSWLSGLQN